MHAQLRLTGNQPVFLIADNRLQK
uniref:Uncharacterized protein n=1 Tax=Anguilla anguilla TaxID=7936 RepID=A0A0E9VFW2_ANGAN